MLNDALLRDELHLSSNYAAIVFSTEEEMYALIREFDPRYRKRRGRGNDDFMVKDLPEIIIERYLSRGIEAGFSIELGEDDLPVWECYCEAEWYRDNDYAIISFEHAVIPDIIDEPIDPSGFEVLWEVVA